MEENGNACFWLVSGAQTHQNDHSDKGISRSCGNEDKFLLAFKNLATERAVASINANRPPARMTSHKRRISVFFVH